MREISSLEAIRDFVRGATILGTGGGGDPAEGLALLEEALRNGWKINLIDCDEIDKNSVAVVPYYVGTVAPEARTKKPVKTVEPIKVAFKEMERLLNEKISAVIASELGGFNASLALYLGAYMGLPVIDGDLLGRAAPELHQCTVHILEIPMYPSVIVTETGNKIAVYEYSDIDDYEAIARYLSVLSGRFAAVVDTPLKIKDAEKIIVKNTMSLCLKVGETIRLGRESGVEPLEEVLKVLGGWKIFEGVVKSYKYVNEGGFLKGTAIVEGVGRWRGKTLHSWIMNEHLMAWINDKPVAMAPDLIIFLDANCEGITNSMLKEGMKVNVVVAKAPELWRTERGLMLFGPKRFGFDYEYVPVENLVPEIL